MVMTFFMLPNVFELYTSKREEFPYYQDVDLLIVDEAGQVSPEVAIPSFSLAKRAIVVGDVYQIPPVWSVDLDIDLEMARNCHTATGNTTKEEFAKRDLNCSSSSLMKLASSVCRFQRYENNRGLFLKEHRRCFEEIITFCNELIYNKIRSLEPLRPDGYEEKKGKLLGSKCPAMGHVSVEHLKSESKDGSRHCQQEADSIANWLADNFKKIKEVYIDTDKDLAKMKEGTEEYAEALKKAIGNAVSVITPFKQQTYDVKIALQNKAQESKINELAVIPCGTVHTFQGAESRIAIFSTVYGKNEPWKFIKDNENLINVAVSRAKDYFFTFGERSIAGGGDTSDNAAQLLLDYTCSEIPKKLVEDKT
jgi:superfamily I DNA and/or RNA helicase